MIAGPWRIVGSQLVKVVDSLAGESDEFIGLEKDGQPWWGLASEANECYWHHLAKMDHENVYLWKGYSRTVRDRMMVLLSDQSILSWNEIVDAHLPDEKILSLAIDWMKGVEYVKSLYHYSGPVITYSSLCATTDQECRGLLRFWKIERLTPLVLHECVPIVRPNMIIGPVRLPDPEAGDRYDPDKFTFDALCGYKNDSQQDTGHLMISTSTKQVTPQEALMTILLQYFKSTDSPNSVAICKCLENFNYRRMKDNHIITELTKLREGILSQASAAYRSVDREFLDFCRTSALKLKPLQLAESVRDEGRRRGHDLKIAQSSRNRSYFAVRLVCRESECPVEIKYIVNHDQITLMGLNLDHSHERHGRILTPADKREIAQLRSRGVRPGRIRMDMGLTCTPDCLYNAARKVLAELKTSSAKDMETLAEEKQSDWMTEIQKNEVGEICTVVFVNRHLSSTPFANDIWLFDDTSCTNTLEMPLVPVIVVDEHGSPQILAICAIRQRSEDQFRYIFETITRLSAAQPRVGVADRHSAQKAAFNGCFGGARLVFCRRHLRQNAKKCLKVRTLLALDAALNSAPKQVFQEALECEIAENSHVRACQKFLEDIDCYAEESLRDLRLLGIRYNNMTEGTFGNVKTLIDFEKGSLAKVFRAFILYSDMQMEAHDRKKVSVLPEDLYHGPPLGHLAQKRLKNLYKRVLAAASAGIDLNTVCNHKNRTEYGLPCDCELFRAFNGPDRPMIDASAIPDRYHLASFRRSVHTEAAEDAIGELIETLSQENSGAPAAKWTHSQMTARFEKVASRAKREEKVMRLVMDMFAQVGEVPGAGAGRPTAHPAHNVDRPPGAAGRPRSRTLYRCSICRRPGHNKATCPENPQRVAATLQLDRMMHPEPHTESIDDLHPEPRTEPADDLHPELRTEPTDDLHPEPRTEDPSDGYQEIDAIAEESNSEMEIFDVLCPPVAIDVRWKFISSCITSVAQISTEELTTADPVENITLNDARDLALLLVYPVANEDMLVFLGILYRALDFEITSQAEFQGLLLASWFHITHKRTEHPELSTEVLGKLRSRLSLEHIRDTIETLDMEHAFPSFDHMYDYMKHEFWRVTFSDSVLDKFLRDRVRHYAQVEYQVITANDIPVILTQFDFLEHDPDGMLMMGLHVLTFRLFAQNIAIPWEAISEALEVIHDRMQQPHSLQISWHRSNLSLALKSLRVDIQGLPWPESLGCLRIHQDIRIDDCTKLTRCILDGHLLANS